MTDPAIWRELFSWPVLLAWLLGMVFGVFVGSTPGLTATMAVALIVPLSFQMEPTAGLALIIGVSFTAIFAGDIPATWLRIPGTPASAAATLDGHELARQGRGGFALLLDLFCSVLGGLIGVGLLILVAPLLARFALLFSNFEYFWLGLLGLGLSALVSQGNTFKGLLSAAFGLLLATIGTDATGERRFVFGINELGNGLEFIPVMIGLFGVSEVIRGVQRKEPKQAGTKPSTAPTNLPALLGSARGLLLAALASVVEALRAMLRNLHVIISSALTGTFIGALPGAGADIAAWGAYGLAQRMSRRPDEFGRGSEQGVIAPTSANNAAVAGAWIPALVFGVPGDAVTAIVLGALMMYNITPGPQVFESGGADVSRIFLIALFTQLLLLPAGLSGILAFGLVMRLRRGIVLAAVLVFSVVGSFALRSSLFDVWVMLVFGLVGYAMENWKFPLAPLILGLILGKMVETKLRAGLIASGGDFSAAFDSWISIVLAALLALSLLATLASGLWRLRRQSGQDRRTRQNESSRPLK